MTHDPRYEQRREFALRFPVEKYEGYAPDSQKTMAMLLEIERDGIIGSAYVNVIGDGSIYLSNGIMVIGGASRPDIANKARIVIEEADNYLDLMSRTDSFPLPGVGERTLYLFTRNGIFLDVAPARPTKWPKIEVPARAIIGALLANRQPGSWHTVLRPSRSDGG